MTKEIELKLLDFYCDGIPEYVKNAGKSFIVINAGSECKGFSPEKITIRDVIDYYKYQANSMSGLRSLAGVLGDWRNINNLAEECLEWFRFVNPKVSNKEDF